MKQIKEPGIYELSNEEYHNQEALNKSGLVQLDRSPAHYNEWYNAPEEEPTRAMVFGTALHTAVLEPKTYDQCIIIAPQIDKRTKDGKAEWAAFEEIAKGKIEIEVKDIQVLKKACTRLGLGFVNGKKTFKWYGSNDGTCDHSITVPGAQYEIGVTQTRDHFDLHCDYYDPNIGKVMNRSRRKIIMD